MSVGDSMEAALRVVCGEEEARELLEEAVRPVGEPNHLYDEDRLFARAETLASRTVTLIRDLDNPALLASVALSIPSRALKIAFLEAIGHRLKR